MERCSCMEDESFIAAATAVCEATKAELDLIYDSAHKEYVWLNKRLNILTAYSRFKTKKEMLADIKSRGYTVWISPKAVGFY